MAQAPHHAGDPNAGRLVVLTAGALGLAGLVGYGVMQVKQREQARAAADRVEVTPPSTAPAPRDVVAQAQRARRDLDTTALVEMEAALATAGSATTSAPKALETQRERLAVLSTLAVEAAVRASVLGDDAARQQATRWATDGRGLIDKLKGQLDPGETTATRARLALAAGDDVTFVHPSVLLPAFRDRELQHVVLAQPLWSSDSDHEPPPPLAGDERSTDDDAHAELVSALERLRDPSGMERLMLAVALRDRGQTAQAQTVVEAVLSTTPDQPLATALRDRLYEDSRVAVAEPTAVPDESELTILPDGPDDRSGGPDDRSGGPDDRSGGPDDSSDGGSDKRAADPAESKPEPTGPTSAGPTSAGPTSAGPTSAGPTSAGATSPQPTSPQPKPTTPQPATPTSSPDPSEPAVPELTEPEPSSPAPKSPPPESAKPKPKSGSSGKRKSPAELTEEGCKLVRGKDPQKGFSMLQRAFDLNPRDTNVTLCMAEAHMKLNRLPSARAMIERVLGKTPHKKRALLLAAKIEHKLGNSRAAAEYYRQVLEVDPDNSTAQSYLEAHS